MIQYDQMRSALSTAVNFDEVKKIRDKAEALAAYARQAKDKDLLLWAGEIKVRAERRAGDMIRERQALGELAKQGRKTSHDGRFTLADFGVEHKQSSRWQQISSVPEPVMEAFIQTCRAGKAEITSSALRRLAKRSKITESNALNIAERSTCATADLVALSAAGERFGTIYADPPWRYGNQGTRGANGGHYVDMSVDEIAALPIAMLADNAAHLHLWTTNAFLFDAKRIIEAWGFEYKSCYVWVKPQIGMGNYWRVSHEFLLFGVRGSCSFRDRSLKSWGCFERREHSEKPEEIRKLIERGSPGPYLELFGRRRVDGWTVWGNDIKRDLFYATA